jgi:hypothetical protein
MSVQSKKRLTASEMKYPERWEHFLNKINSGTPFLLMDGRQVLIPKENNGTLINALNDRIQAHYSAAFREGVTAIFNGETITLWNAGDLHKSSDFGGKSSGHSLRAQRLQISHLNDAIQILGRGQPIPIFLGNRTESVLSIIEAKNGEKADAHLLNEEGQIVGRVSLKYAEDPHEMQQWSGLSAFIENRQIDSFIKLIKNSLPLKSHIREHIESPQICIDSLYGDDPKPVDLIVATKSCGLRERPGCTAWEFTGNVWYYPQIPTVESGWAPTLGARPSTSRKDLGVTGVRFGIFPSSYRDSVKKSENM